MSTQEELLHEAAAKWLADYVSGGNFRESAAKGLIEPLVDLLRYNRSHAEDTLRKRLHEAQAIEVYDLHVQYRECLDFERRRIGDERARGDRFAHEFYTVTQAMRVVSAHVERPQFGSMPMMAPPSVPPIPPDPRKR